MQERTNELLDLIHNDFCDFKSTPTGGENNYFIFFIDDCSKHYFVYLIKSKDEVLDTFKTYKAEVENQLNIKKNRMEVKNIKPLNLLIFVHNMELFLKQLHHIHYNKMM